MKHFISGSAPQGVNCKGMPLLRVRVLIGGANHRPDKPTYVWMTGNGS